jgi:hypothetical protein
MIRYTAMKSPKKPAEAETLEKENHPKYKAQPVTINARRLKWMAVLAIKDFLLIGCSE